MCTLCSKCITNITFAYCLFIDKKNLGSLNGTKFAVIQFQYCPLKRLKEFSVTIECDWCSQMNIFITGYLPLISKATTEGNIFHAYAITLHNIRKVHARQKLYSHTLKNYAVKTIYFTHYYVILFSIITLFHPTETRTLKNIGNCTIPLRSRSCVSSHIRITKNLYILYLNTMSYN